MEAQEAVKILAKVKANWYRQPSDTVIAGEWADCLSRVSYEDAIEAVNHFRDEGDTEPPAPGQIYRFARELEERRAEDNRRKIRMLTPPKPTLQEMATMRSLVESTLRKISGGRSVKR